MHLIFLRFRILFWFRSLAIKNVISSRNSIYIARGKKHSTRQFRIVQSIERAIQLIEFVGAVTVLAPLLIRSQNETESEWQNF